MAKPDIESIRYYAVIDTNVLVSALLKWESVPGQVANEALNGRIVPLLNNSIVAEYEDVLCRRKFPFDHRTVRVLIDGIIQRGIFVDAGPVDELVPDPKDVVFYEVAMEHRKESDNAYLVTGNIKHFPVRSFVVTPRMMLDIIEKNS